MIDQIEGFAEVHEYNMDSFFSITTIIGGIILFSLVLYWRMLR